MRQATSLILRPNFMICGESLGMRQATCLIPRLRESQAGEVHTYTHVL